MKLCSIWCWEEISLMYSCNDCSRENKRGKRQKCLPLLHLDPLKRIKALFFLFKSSVTPRLCSSGVTHIPTRRLALTLEMSNCFDTPRPQPFDSWRMFVVLPKDALCKEVLMFEGSLLVKHEEDAPGSACLLFGVK